MRNLFHYLSFALILASCRQASDNKDTSSSNVSAEKQVEAKLAEYYRDMSERNWEKYRKHFWENATITTAWQQPGDSSMSVDVTTIDDFVKEAPQGPGSQPIFEETMKSSEIKVKGNLAEAWVRYHAKFGSEENLMEWEGTDVFTLLRHNGEWRIVSLVFESDE